jgi:hypothetical protein
MRILFVAMSQSLHTSRWIGQLDRQAWDLHLFPSCGNPFHPTLCNLTVYQVPWCKRPFLARSLRARGWLTGWLLPRNALYGQAQRLFPRLVDASKQLAKVIEESRPQLIHSLEIQHAGYLTLAARDRVRQPFPPWIVTGWGSDTYYFRHFPEHEAKLRRVFAACDFYACECERDVRAARELGFRGTTFPVSPNTGGFNLPRVWQLRQPGPTSKRRVILVKGYQSWAGRALNALAAVGMAADALKDYEIAIYLASWSVRREAARLRRRMGLRITVLGRLSHEEMLRWHGRARMSIGINITDGVSTSFLEALVMGSFPIQTCTACCDEWIKHGESGWIVRPDDIEGIAGAIRRAATDDDLVDQAAAINWDTATRRLDETVLRQRAVEMYLTAAGAPLGRVS